MSRLPPTGVAKGHRGRPIPAFLTPRPPGRNSLYPPMKPYPIFAATLVGGLVCGTPLNGQVQTPPATIEAKFPEPVPQETPSEQPAPVEKPDFEIEATQVKLIDVVEAPPMTGLPPVEGTMTLTIHSVADPKLPVTAATEVPSSPTTPVIEPEGALPETHLLNVSATVYDQSRTLLQCRSMEHPDQFITVWSNINFNHFCGVGNFESKGADGKLRGYHLMMGIGNEEGKEPADGSQIPNLPIGNPAFVIVSENPAPEAVRLVEDLHALYRAQGAKMAADVIARQKAEDEKRAYLLANPPKPKDVTVHFWKRDTETPTQEGGQP